MKSTSKMTSLAFALLPSLVLFACSRTQSASSEAQTTPPEAPEEPASSRDGQGASVVRRFESSEGLLEVPARIVADANDISNYAASFTLSIVQVAVSLGEQVEEGAVLLEVVVPEAGRAMAMRDAANIRRTAYQTRLSQLEGLRQEGLVRGSELADARAKLAEAEASLAEANGLLRSIEATGLHAHQHHFDLRARYAGVVVALNASVGSVHAPSDQILVSVVRDGRKRVEARVPFFAHPTFEARLHTSFGSVILSRAGSSPRVEDNDGTRLHWFDIPSGPMDQQLAVGSIARLEFRPAGESFWIDPRCIVTNADTVSVTKMDGTVVAVEPLLTLQTRILVQGNLQDGEALLLAGRAP